MKLDQETIVKHQFWFLLGGYFLLWFIAVLCLKFIAPGKIEEFQKAYDGAASGVKTAQSGGPINTATFLPPWDKEAKTFSDHKSVIWGDAWNYQKDMYDWPEEWLTKYDMTNPQAPLTPDDRNEYKDKLYLNQIENLRAYAPKWLNPVELKGSFNDIFKPMTAQDWKEPPTREEIWLIQEDFWVKRELFLVVYDAMIRQAVMQPEKIDEPNPDPENIKYRYRFKNKNWVITLHLRSTDKGLVIGGDSTIKNIHPSHHPQPLTSAKGKGIWFNVFQDNVRTLFEVRGEPVSWSETKRFSAENYPTPLSGINWDEKALKDHPIVVSQGFDQTNSPIRRINAIELAKQDCRSFIWPLQPNHTLAALDPLAEEDLSKTGGGGGPPGGMSAPPGMPAPPMGGMPQGGPAGGMPGMFGMRGRGPTGNKTPNNEIERNRYLQSKDQDKKVNPPSRHLPVALQLVVEQTHMHDVLIALANSRLRFQITQVDFRHDKEYVPQSEGDKKDGTDTAGRVFMGGGMPGMYAGIQQQRQQQQDDRNAQMQRQMLMQRMQRQMQMQRGMMRQPPGMGGMSTPVTPTAPSTPQGGRSTPVGGTDPKQTASTSQDDNLVELTVYGIATLYRAPDAPQTTGQGGQPGSLPPPAAQQPAATTPAPQPPAAKTTPSSSPPPAEKQADQPVNQQKAPPTEKQPEQKKPATPPTEKQPEQKKPATPPGGKS
ncbi:MAG TPA: hypothetical protein VMF69_00840 [Gemmataceae bacterium]|nr:hypothetical protein [Gemmataceae bacterium]